MNIYPAKPDPGGPPAPEEWTMSLDSEGQGEASFYFANVYRADVQMCRLSLTGKVGEEDARRVLAVKARLWISDYLSRAPGDEKSQPPV